MSNDQLLKLLRLSGERSSADGSGIRLCDEAADAIERLSAANLSLESRVSQQARTIAEVFKKVGDMERDAARYRWLRNTDPQPARMLDVCNDFLIIIDGKELDEAIDAALAQKEAR